MTNVAQVHATGYSLVIPPLYGQLEQGTIFSGGRAERYQKLPVFGLIITARCDIAHGKAAVVNYLPVVRLEDWLLRDFLAILIDQAASDELGKIRALLLQHGFSPSILNFKSPQAILETLFEHATHSGKKAKARERLQEACDRLHVLDQVANEDPAADVLRQVSAFFGGHAKTIINRCCRQQLNGYYFLPYLDPTLTDTSGFVVLLREVNHLPARLAIHLSRGLDRFDFEKLSAADPKLASSLSFEATDFAAPQGTVNSPAIEQLVQSFSLLFSRIGVADLADSYVNGLLVSALERD